MRRAMVVLLVAVLMPTVAVQASQDPFNFYVDDEVVVHPGETVQFRIAWQNIVGSERHFSLSLNSSDSNISVNDLPTDWTRVASGRLGEMFINVTAASGSNYETQSFSLDFTCQEITNWSHTEHVQVLISKWSDIRLGANDGSGFFVQQNVNTSFAVNVSNQGNYDDTVKLNFNTQTTWDYGFDDDLDRDGELVIDLDSGEFEFVTFWIQTPPILDGGPLAGTGPSFKLLAESTLDRRIDSWDFELQMQTYQNMTIDFVGENLSIDPGDNQRLEVKVRNNGNIETFLNASLRHGSFSKDRVMIDNWTVAIFNAFQSQPLQPNESRTIEIGFDAPNTNYGFVDLELEVMPQSFPHRGSIVSLSSEINWEKNGTITKVDDSCIEVAWNETCQQLIQIENTGNFFQNYLLELRDSSGMNFEIGEQAIGLSKGQTSLLIPINISTITDAEAFLPGSVILDLVLPSGEVMDSIEISSRTAPRVFWTWEDSATSVDDGRLEISITMRNGGNAADGLVVRMTSSYYTEMSFIPPNEAIIEDDSQNIRSFEILNIDKGTNFTFRAWAKIPDNQKSSDDFYLNITAHSRLSDDKTFRFSANASFDVLESSKEDTENSLESVSEILSTTFAVLWAWKWIIIATVVSGLMINKSIRDRRERLANIDLMNTQQKVQQKPEDWMAEFKSKKQPVPEIPQSPKISSQEFAGMFQAVGGDKMHVNDPVDSRLIGAANAVLDPHRTSFAPIMDDENVQNNAPVPETFDLDDLDL